MSEQPEEQVIKLRPHHAEKYFWSLHNLAGIVEETRKGGYDEHVVDKAVEIYNRLFVNNEPFMLVSTVDDLCGQNRLPLGEYKCNHMSYVCWMEDSNQSLSDLRGKLGELVFHLPYFPIDIIKKAMQQMDDWRKYITRLGCNVEGLNSRYDLLERTYLQLKGGIHGRA